MLARFLAIVIMLFVSSSLQAQSVDSGLVKKRPKSLCVCGYNTRTTCDGTYTHYISDCYDEQMNYCGYDDQIGELCGDIRRYRKRVSKPHPVKIAPQKK
jgi:hypothetical protein